ncbi:MAG: LacI family DNA-binding transcriptional regulator [Steroidobacteraceae bacterium]|jgi:DNA-binding LacI/PurR family transcriptional regulator|nr:LacI family DNA-binding transcriptional regulator [Steroidobacteraceae bacterium]
MPKKKLASAVATAAADPDRRATSYDVALRAGVSQSAVSRCFKPGASVSAKMRERVMRAARELGYTPNAIARSLITRRSNLIAVLLSNLTSLYYPEVLSELAEQASRRGVRILLFTLPRESDIDHVLDQVLQYQVDGVVAAVRLSPAQLATFDRRRIPVVFFNRYLRDTPVNAVCCDQFEGSRAMVSRLHAAGHRRFGVIAGPEDSVVGQERLRGALERLAELGVRDVPVIPGSYDYDSGVNGLHELVKRMRRPPDAVICGNDVMAIGCIDAARFDFGLDVPGRLSVVGFDGVGPSVWSSYRLTTVRQPLERMAEATITLLMDRVENPGLPPEKRVLSGQFVEGASAKLA